jgi:hypothetical protein
MHSLISGFSPEAQDTQVTIHRPHEAQEEGRPTGLEGSSFGNHFY